MIIAVLQHGLGNQLFQYATGRAVAARLQTPLLLDATCFTYLKQRELDLKKLRVRARFLPDSIAKLLTPGQSGNPLKTLAKTALARGFQIVTDANAGYDPAILPTRRFARLDGFWQSELYFAHLRPQLLAECAPRVPLPPALAAFAEQLSTHDSIALHVRRGDLIAEPHYAETVGSLTPAYYEEALQRLRAHLPRARVYVFSDDPAWCDAHLPRVLPLEIVSGSRTRSAVEDLAVMKRCRHFVIANSTFSWWAAWLGEHPAKQVIAPARFFRVPRPWEKDLLPASWETVDATLI